MNEIMLTSEVVLLKINVNLLKINLKFDEALVTIYHFFPMTLLLHLKFTITFIHFRHYISNSNGC